MKSVVIEKHKILDKWANLIFAIMTVSSFLLSLGILWVNRF